MCGICSTTGVTLLRTPNLHPTDGGAPPAALPPYPKGGFTQDMKDPRGFSFEEAKQKYSAAGTTQPGAQVLSDLVTMGRRAWWIPVGLLLVLVAVAAARR